MGRQILFIIDMTVEYEIKPGDYSVLVQREKL
jgi:hypothetical protein